MKIFIPKYLVKTPCIRFYRNFDCLKLIFWARKFFAKTDKKIEAKMKQIWKQYNVKRYRKKKILYYNTLLRET